MITVSLYHWDNKNLHYYIIKKFEGGLPSLSFTVWFKNQLLELVYNTWLRNFFGYFIGTVLGRRGIPLCTQQKILLFWLVMENVSSSLIGQSSSWVQQTEWFLFLHSENFSVSRNCLELQLASRIFPISETPPAWGGKVGNLFMFFFQHPRVKFMLFLVQFTTFGTVEKKSKSLLEVLLPKT